MRTHCSVLRLLAGTLLLLAVLPLAPAVEASAPVQSGLAAGAVVALRGTPHLWVADEHGVLHWGGDTRALAAHAVRWGQRLELPLERVKALPRGDPWLSTGLLKDGDRIYLVKWETDAPLPSLIDIRTVPDLELFGITGANYTRFLIDRAQWEQQHGVPVASLPLGQLPDVRPAAPAPAPLVSPGEQPAAVLSGWAIYVRDRSAEGKGLMLLRVFQGVP
jgi:hypothetical protein